MNKKLKTKLALLIYLLLLWNTIVAQENESLEDKKRASTTFNISFFNHSVSVPFYKILRTPIHPGMRIGAEKAYFQKTGHTIFQNLNIGMFFNKYNGTGFYTNTALGFRYASKFGISADIDSGVGYLRVYHPTDIFKLTSSGKYERQKDKGFSSPIFTWGLGIGYKIPIKSTIDLSPFLRYSGLIQTRYSDVLAIFPQSTFHLGLRIKRN